MRTALACLALAAITLLAGQVRGQEPADAAAGKAVYDSVCKACHATSLAPTLRGVADRKVASVATFDGYSEGLKAKGELTWTAANLEAFLKAPAAFAPGTHMVQATPDDVARANLVAYLLTLKPPAS